MADVALKDIEIKIIKDELGFSKTEIKIESLIVKFLEYNRTNLGLQLPNATKQLQITSDGS